MEPRLKSRCARCCGAGSRLMSLIPLFTAQGPGPTVLMLHDADIPRNEAILLDLRDTDLTVVSAVNPKNLPLNVVEYLAPRGRVDYYIEGAD